MPSQSCVSDCKKQVVIIPLYPPRMLYLIQIPDPRPQIPVQSRGH
jgi:hypothetical protein